MALAETAKLLTELDLKDNATPGFQHASQAAVSYGAATDRAATKTSFLSRSMKGGSDALHHFGGRVSQVTQLLGAGGLLGGVLGITVAVKHGVDAAQEWGKTTDRLTQLTGVSRRETSAFSDAFDKLGLKAEQQTRIVGFASKTLGNLAQDTKKAKEMQKAYGFQLLDSHGKVKNAFQVIQDFTSYFNNKHIPAYQKASLGAKLFGRGWTDLIPIFEQGRGKMDRAMKDAMHLTDAQVKDIHRYRDAQRNLNDTIGDLSVQIGLAAMPALTQLSRAASDFLDKNSWKIRQLFNQGLEAAKNFGAFMANEVLPNLGNLASSAASFWNGIPGPIKDILVKGFVADRAIKFAFGFSITGLATDALKDAIGGGLSRMFGRGSSPATPMYVKAVGVGGLGGGPGGVAAGGGGMGILGKAALGAELVGSVVAVYQAVDENILKPVAAQQTALMQQAQGIIGEGRDKAAADIANMTRLLHDAQGADRVVIDTTSSKELGTALVNAAREISGGSTAGTRNADIQALIDAQKQATEHGWTQAAADIGVEIDKLKGGKGGAASKADVREALDQAIRSDPKKQGDLSDRIGLRIGRTMGDLSRMIGRQDTSKMSGKLLAPLNAMHRQLAKAWTSDKDNAHLLEKAIRTGERAQRQALREGHTKLARNLGNDLAQLRRVTSGGLGNATRELGNLAQKPPPVVNVTTNVTSTIGIRDSDQANTVIQRYGRAVA